MELTLKHVVKSSSIAERQCRNFSINTMERHNEHIGSKLIERTKNKIFYKSETNFTFEKYVIILRVFSMCWRNMVFHSTRSRWSSIY